MLAIGVNTGSAFKDITLGIYASFFTNFNDAITAAANKKLYIDASINLPAGAIIIPSNVSVEPIQGGVINKGSATSLTINGPVVGNPMHQWLSGFAATEILGLKEMRVEWVGAVGDGNTESATALQLAFDWWMAGSNRTVIMRGNYKSSTALTIASSTSAINSKLDAAGATITTYNTGVGLTTGGSGKTFTRNTIDGLRIAAGSSNVNTLLKISEATFDSKFHNIHLIGYGPTSRTKQGLLMYGLNAYFSTFTNLTVWDCDYQISINKDQQTGDIVPVPGYSNATRIIGFSSYNQGVCGIYTTQLASCTFVGLDFTNAGASSTEDIYIGADSSDNIFKGRHESMTYNASGGPYTHNIAASATITGNYLESNLWSIVNGAAQQLRENIIVKLSSTNSSIAINTLRARYLYNHTDQPISIINNGFSGGNDAITIDSNGPNFPAGYRSATSTPASASATGVTGQWAWDASYIYICTATNTWKRVAIVAW